LIFGIDLVRWLDTDIQKNYTKTTGWCEGKEVMMLNPMQIEESFKEFMSHLPECAHDGVISVDMRYLHDLGILRSLQEDQSNIDDLTQYFHVIESAEKVTLFNEQFIVWILPKMDQTVPTTLVLIALNCNGKPRLELVFNTTGVYNTPHYVLKIMQYFLLDVIETEKTVLLMEENS
jgi:hypothetical protein